MNTTYATDAPTRAEVDALAGPALLEFGTGWCGWCQGAQPHLAAALQGHASLRHLKVEDGPGRPLGRSYKVKLWPTFIFLKDGRELARVVRPAGPEPLQDGLRQITAGG